VARRNALGRGLDALLPPTPPASDAPKPEPGSTHSSVPSRTPPAEASDVASLASDLPIDDIAPNPDQPRRHFAEEDLASLADSIQRHGVLQPVVVRRARAGAGRPYELIVGERRWRASQRAGRTTLPATIQDVAPDALLEIALVENVQRADLNPIELALAFRALADGGLTQEQVGQRVGLDRSSVANHLRLLELPRELQQDVESGALSAGHAKALLQLTNPERRRQLRERIVAQGLSVRAAEESARELAGPSAVPRKKPSRAVDPNLQDLINSLQAHLQTRVRIVGGGRRGKIEIDFHGAEELHRVTLAMLEGGRPS
jgi:ParB family chromosome partitioning protein